MEAETNVRDFCEMVGGRKIADGQNKRVCLAVDVVDEKKCGQAPRPRHGKALPPAELYLGKVINLRMNVERHVETHSFVSGAKRMGAEDERPHVLFEAPLAFFTHLTCSFLLLFLPVPWMDGSWMDLLLLLFLLFGPHDTQHVTWP